MPLGRVYRMDALAQQVDDGAAYYGEAHEEALTPEEPTQHAPDQKGNENTRNHQNDTRDVQPKEDDSMNVIGNTIARDQWSALSLSLSKHSSGTSSTPRRTRRIRTRTTPRMVKNSGREERGQEQHSLTYTQQQRHRTRTHQGLGTQQKSRTCSRTLNPQRKQRTLQG